MQSPIVGNVAALVDSSGDIQEGYTYTAYGEALVHTGMGNDATWFTSDDTTAVISALDNPYTFTGRRLDPETLLMYFRFRIYNPATGTFISHDPLGYIEGMSLYLGYFAPFSVDPLGLVVDGPPAWLGKCSPKCNRYVRKIAYVNERKPCREYSNQVIGGWTYGGFWSEVIRTSVRSTIWEIGSLCVKFPKKWMNVAFTVSGILFTVSGNLKQGLSVNDYHSWREEREIRTDVSERIARRLLTVEYECTDMPHGWWQWQPEILEWGSWEFGPVYWTDRVTMKEYRTVSIKPTVTFTSDYQIVYQEKFRASEPERDDRTGPRECSELQAAQ